MRLSLLVEQALTLVIGHPVTVGAAAGLAAGLLSWLLTRTRNSA